MRKCLICLLLGLCLVLTGCGGGEEVRGTVEAPAEGTVPATEAALDMGTLEGGSYRNAYAGIGCDLDESWVIYGAEDLQQLPQAVLDAVEGSEMGALMEGVEQFTDFQAENADLMANVNLVYVKQDLTSRLAFQLLSDEEVVDANLAQKELLTESYAQAGMEVSTMEKAPVTFLGRETWAMKTTAQMDGLDVYLLQLFNFKAGAYGLTLTCASFAEDNTEQLLELFYEVE